MNELGKVIIGSAFDGSGFIWVVGIGADDGEVDMGWLVVVRFIDFGFIE